MVQQQQQNKINAYFFSNSFNSLYFVSTSYFGNFHFLCLIKTKITKHETNYLYVDTILPTKQLFTQRLSFNLGVHVYVLITKHKE